MPEGNNGSKPATKADLAALEVRFDARLEALKNSMIEAVRDSQTEILRAFERYASSEQKARFVHFWNAIPPTFRSPERRKWLPRRRGTPYRV